MSFDGRERRQFERRPISMQVKYRSLDTFFYDYALNISHGGIFIKTRRPLSRGAEVELEFDIPGAPHPFKTRGKVMRVILPGEDDAEPSGMGVEFDPLSDEDKELIDILWKKTSEGEASG